jgi:SAM-dependent methyltransferase
VLCQEGIEHFSDQLKALKEFNRVLKKGGRLLLTTPSYSNLKAKASYLLFESEYFHKLMPPNEIDSIWMSDKSITGGMYHGHIFLTGIQKLRLLGKIAGFSIAGIPFMRVNKTSLALFPFLFPIIVISSYITRWRSMRKNRGVPDATKAAVYNEQLALNVSPRILLDEHLFIIFEKSRELGEVTFGADGMFKQFTAIM